MFICILDLIILLCRYYLEIHIYITGVDPIPKKVGPLYRATRNMINYGSTPAFSADDLYGNLFPNFFLFSCRL